MRNILDRLGSPEEIVAGEVAQSGSAGGAATMADGTLAPLATATGAIGARSGMGAVEVWALILIGLAWPALFLPFGLFLWGGFGVVGLVLTWASGHWSTRQKLITTGIVVALYVLVIVVVTPVRTVGTPVGSPIVQSH